MADLVSRDGRGGVLVLTLNRPDVLNAVDTALRSALIQECRSAEADPGVKAIVITGAGRAFCAGQDLAEAVGYELAHLRGWLDRQRAMYQAVRDLTKPCIAAFNGTAAGAGFQIGLCCDLRVTHPAAKIGQPEVRAGLASIVGSYLMGLHIGLAHNIELSLRGSLITGERGHQIGLINYLTSESEVLAKAIELAGEMSEISPIAMQLTKSRFREVTQPGFDAACEAGVRAQLEAYATGEPQRVMRSFLDKRSQA